ncbi:Murein DD-endopeptidase MepM [Devosia equisanguinis]|uniref:Murein DD-endopeptidase MepM n=1 Tax=Devosia equisanguinis TaxID=2490941 RepID=A0A3S4GJ92_9HYPH|nr:M23 family metallopeptidase [Devosia equisanguinis]VDS05979.1 Murein DD-endopeptidase MepM [Devosia equisanguinis]
MLQASGYRRSETKGAALARKGIHPALFYGLFAALLGTNALTATGLLMAPDIARLMSGQNNLVVSAYEDRLAQMRVEIDRLHSRSYAQAGDINLQLQELAQQQDVLLEQHQLVRVLVEKADQLGIAAVKPDASVPKPQMTIGAAGNPDVPATAQAVAQMMEETQMAMTGIATAANQRTEGISSELGKLGIRLQLPEAGLNGVGGPLLDAVDGADASPMIEDANAVMDALLRYKVARDSLDSVPVHMPIAGNFRRSSGFGNRTDPFTGGRAFHAGLDWAAPSGTTVLSAAAGVVSFVGTKSGYGNVIEVSHANGLMTRYAHLSAFLTKEGQAVQAGTPIAKVGSTGRSTGPHLHLEVRRDDQAIDPSPFMDAGKRLMAMVD